MDIKDITEKQKNRYKDSQNRNKTTAFSRSLDELKKINDDWVEYWMARDIMKILDYTTWRSFENVISRAKDNAKNSWTPVEEHFLLAPAKNNWEKWRPSTDYFLTRLACYYTAQNADPRIEAVAYAKQYFTIQARRQENSDQENEFLERYASRRWFAESYKGLSTHLMSEKWFQPSEMKETIDKWNQHFYQEDVKRRRKRLWLPSNANLADYENPLILDARSLANKATINSTQDLIHKDQIQHKHIESNKSARAFLESVGVDIKKSKPLEHINQSKKKAKKNNRWLKDRVEQIHTSVKEKYQKDMDIITNISQSYKIERMPDDIDKLHQFVDILKKWQWKHKLSIGDKKVVMVSSEALQRIQSELGARIDQCDDIALE